MDLPNDFEITNYFCILYFLVLLEIDKQIVYY